MNLTIHGCYDIPNFGDVLLAQMLAERVRRTFGVQPVIPMMGRRGRVRWLRQFRESDYCIWGGGGYFCDSSSYAKELDHFSKYLFPAISLRSSGVPYSILCPGAGPLTTLIGRTSTRYICNGARVLVVRDEESREIIAGTGVPEENIQVAADFVLSLQPDSIPRESTEAARQLLPESDGHHWIGVHLESFQRSNPGECAELVHSLVKLADRHAHVRLAFICDHSGSAHQYFNTFIAGHQGRHIALARQNTWTTLALLRRMSAILTSKLHVGIAGYSVGVPVFGLWTHSKTPRFYRMIGRDDSQAPFLNWREVLATWFNRFASPDAERIRFAKEYARKTGFAAKIEASYAAVCRDIATVATRKSGHQAA